MSELVFNELSLHNFESPSAPVASDIPTARQWMSAFIEVLREAPSLGLPRSLRTQEDFAWRPLAPDYSMERWRNDAAVAREQRLYFKLWTTRSPLLQGVVAPIVERKELSEAFHNGCLAEGLLAAHLLDAIAVSLTSSSTWDVSSVTMLLRAMNDSGTIEDIDQDVAHAATPGHLAHHKSWVSARRFAGVTNGIDLLEQWRALFPNLELCGNTETTIRGLGGRHPGFRWLLARLVELQDAVQQWSEAGFPHELLNGNPSIESESVRTNPSLRAAREIAGDDGVVRYFEWHMKYHAINWRLHYFPDPARRSVLIGYYGRHLPTANY